MADMIEIKHLNKYFGDLHVLKDINLTVKRGEKLVMIGPSGSGKSTLIRCVDYLEEPTSGEVVIDGTPLTKKNHLEMARKYSSMVFQQFNLYPNMTVLGAHQASKEEQGGGDRDRCCRAQACWHGA